MIEKALLAFNAQVGDRIEVGRSVNVIRYTDGRSLFFAMLGPDHFTWSIRTKTYPMLVKYFDPAHVTYNVSISHRDDHGFFHRSGTGRFK
jgi:hypothetical protein